MRPRQSSSLRVRGAVRAVIMVAASAVALLGSAVSAPAVNLLVNGSFDAGPGAPWVETGSFPIIVSPSNVPPLPVPPHDGNFAAWFGAQGSPYFDSLHQDVTVPPGITLLSLELFYWIERGNPQVPLDQFSLRVDGSEVFALTDTTVSPAAWTRAVVDLTPFVGQTTLRIHLSSTNNSPSPFDPTFFFIDTISLNALGPTQVTESPTLALFAAGLCCVIVLGTLVRRRETR